MYLRLRLLFLASLFGLVALGVGPCSGGGSTGPALRANPTSLSFSGIESKSVTIEWGGFNTVVVANETITGTNKSSFSFPSGKHCEVEFSSAHKTCVETVRLNEAKTGLHATLVLENQYGNLEIPLSS